MSRDYRDHLNGILLEPLSDAEFDALKVGDEALVVEFHNHPEPYRAGLVERKTRTQVTIGKPSLYAKPPTVVRKGGKHFYLAKITPEVRAYILERKLRQRVSTWLSRAAQATQGPKLASAADLAKLDEIIKAMPPELAELGLPPTELLKKRGAIPTKQDET